MNISLIQLNTDNDNIRHLTTFLLKYLGKEFSGLTNPCWYPSTIELYSELKRYTGIDEIDMKVFIKRMRDSTIRMTGETTSVSSNLNILSDKLTNLIVISILFYSREKKYDLVKLFMYLFAIRFYSNRIHKMFKFCKEDVWEKSLQSISQKHLFKLKNGIQNSLIYLSEDIFRKHITKLSSYEISPLEILRFVYELRHRIAQSVRSFSNKYYELEREMHGDNSSEQKTHDEESIAVNLVLEKLTQSMCVYSEMDKAALIKSISIVKINKELGEKIISEFSDVDYKENIKFILILMNRLIGIKDWCSESKRNSLIRKVIYDSLKINNHSIKKLIDNMINELPSFYMYETMNRNVLILFICNYLTLYVAHKFCGH